MPGREPIQNDIHDELLRNLADIQLGQLGQLGIEKTRDEIPTFWISRDRLKDLLGHLKEKKDQPYSMLYDLTAIDERARGEALRIPKSIEAARNREEPPSGDFTLVYHLLSLERASEIRVKVRLDESDLKAPTITDLWPSANWYEREAWDMFGIRFEGHPNLRRILLPPAWQGHPLRKEHPARATEMAPYQLPEEPGSQHPGRNKDALGNTPAGALSAAFSGTFAGALEDEAQEALRFRPEEWGLKRSSDGSDFLFLNLGPHHVGTHGVLRIILQLKGEEVLESIPDIGYHHRAAEKMGERQTWHTYLPYTDRVDYLGGVMNNFPYVLCIEKLAGIEVPDRARVIRILLAELFRIASHLVWYGTFAQDVGALSPVFYMFSDRERIFEIIEAITGGRMHPSWFRIGGVAADLPENWRELVTRFLHHLPKRLDEYDAMVMKNRIFQARTRGVGAYSLKEAIEWGVTGPGLRACGLEWDLRKKRPYAGYDQFDFDIPTATNGDSYDRAVVRIEEMRQSLRIIQQCVKNMPPGPVLASHPCAAPPPKEKTLKDIETLITHFLSVSWGPVIPEGEAHVAVEATKGLNGYYLVSDGNTRPYRVRIRTPSFPHLQMLKLIGPGHRVADILAILGSMDYVLADVDR